MLSKVQKVALSSAGLYAEASQVAAGLDDYCLSDARKICALALKFKEGADSYFKEEEEEDVRRREEEDSD